MTATRRTLQRLFDALLTELVDRLAALRSGTSRERSGSGERALLRVVGAFLKDQNATLGRDLNLATEERWKLVHDLWDSLARELVEAFQVKPVPPQTLRAAADFLSANGVSAHAGRSWEMEHRLQEIDDDWPDFLN